MLRQESSNEEVISLTDQDSEYQFRTRLLKKTLHGQVTDLVYEWTPVEGFGE